VPLVERGESHGYVHREVADVPRFVSPSASDRRYREHRRTDDDDTSDDRQPDIGPISVDLHELLAERQVMTAGISDDQQRGMTEKHGPDHKTQAPMPAEQSVAPHGRLDPGQAADEDQLQQSRGANQEPDQSPERDRTTAWVATQEQAAGQRATRRTQPRRRGPCRPFRAIALG
jgi:hypothetical protein